MTLKNYKGLGEGAQNIKIQKKIGVRKTKKKKHGGYDMEDCWWYSEQVSFVL